ncbi:MAG: site-2 protease family protein [Clostridia bacterium]|nr:site-2 protease family protein [Clostridia bacterium]
MQLISLLSHQDYLSAIAFVFSAAMVIFLVLPFHEYAHAFAANKLGDPTARYQGRLSLNPMRHIDWFGAALIMLAGFGWAKPVPVNTRYFKRPKWDMALTALAGPVSNLLMAIVALLLKNIVLTIGVNTETMFALSGDVVGYISNQTESLIVYFFYVFFMFLATINVALAVFNLLPIPPLDGSRLLTAFLPNRLYYTIMQYEQYIMMGLFVLIFMGVLDGPLNFLRSGVLDVLDTIADLPFGY